MALCWPIPAAAVVLEPLSIDALTAQADLVLHGVVLSKTCQRDPSGRIFTTVELEVTDVWKGAISGNPFVIVHGGGILGEQQAVVAAQVQYDLGEEVVAFLVRNARAEGVTIGLMQGKFRVWKDAVSGARYAANPFHGLLNNAGGTPIVQLGSARPQSSGAPMPLDELRKQVRRRLR